MITKPIELPNDLNEVKKVCEAAFSTTLDSSLEDWFSFEEMVKSIINGRGMCIKAIDENGEMVGVVYAQQENPINGREGLEKWVIIIAAVDPTFSGKGVGSLLLTNLEKIVKERGGIKIFVFTNKDDEKVINFYKKNGYDDAGWIKDYQYGKNNSAVFLLKYL